MDWRGKEAVWLRPVQALCFPDTELPALCHATDALCPLLIHKLICLTLGAGTREMQNEE